LAQPERLGEVADAGLVTGLRLDQAEDLACSLGNVARVGGTLPSGSQAQSFLWKLVLSGRHSRALTYQFIRDEPNRATDQVSSQGPEADRAREKELV
jgi:hypothetical protein